MFRKRRLTNQVTPGNDAIPGRSKRQRIADGAKILLDIAKESSDAFVPLKSTLGGVNALIKHYEEFKDVKEKIEDLVPQLYRFRQNADVSMSGGDQAEANRRLELSSALGRIEKRSRELLDKGKAARFVDKRADSGEVASLVDQLREAITHYQISQQQAIYERITDLTSSFDNLLKLHEKSPAVKKKLDSVMARLDLLFSGEDSGDDNEDERWAKLFHTLRQIRDKGNVLYDRINAQGHDECQDDIQAVSGIVEDIRDTVLDFQMTQQRAIYEQTCKLIDAADLSVLNSCRRSPGAGFRHGNRRGCLRGTRETVLEEIESWTKDFEKSPVFWLNGLAGTGKSTVAQTISERAFADGLLGASFFCSRDFEDRSDLHFIFPTLAFQLAQKYSEFRSVFVRLLQSNPDIVHESLYSQMEKLIVEPLESARISTTIVIDALDECKDEEPSSAILSVLGRLVERISRVKFFITGRPEPRIKTGFRLPLLKDATNVFVLHDVHPLLINNDIRLFLRHELSELAHRHQMGEWPSDEQINLLCQRAGGLFVYAVATVKFLDSPFFLPSEQLETISGSPESTTHEGKTELQGNKTLDSLYVWILNKSFRVEHPRVFSKFRSILGTVILLVNPLSPPVIAQLMGLKTEQVMLYLRLIQSLLLLDEDFGQPVKPFHKSFPDFIMDPSRCADERFYISPERLHLELVANCLRVMNEGLEQNLLSLPDYSLNSDVEDLEARIQEHISVALRYGCQSWHNHLTMVKGDFANIIPQLQAFLEKKFLAWLEVLSVLKATRGAVVALERLMSWIDEVARDEQLLYTARDCFYFVTRFFEPINVSATHIYHSALELSPHSSIVRALYYHQRPTPFPTVGVGIPGSQDLSTSIPSSNQEAATWSPCGQFIAVREGVVVEIRNGLTFELVSTLQPPKQKASPAAPPSYLPDGRSIACVTNTHIIIWDIQTGGVVREIQCSAIGCQLLVWLLDGQVFGVLFSQKLCWSNIAPGGVVQTTMFDSRCIRHLWAKNESFGVITSSKDGDACILDIYEVRPPRKFEIGYGKRHIGSFSVLEGEDSHFGSFSTSTYRVSGGTGGKTAKLFILDIWTLKKLLVEKGDSQSHSFSSDGSCFAAYQSAIVHIWKYDSGQYIPWRQFQPTATCGDIAFSPTMSSIVVRDGGTLRLWHLNYSSTAPIISTPQLDIISHYGTCIATAHYQESTVTITNHLSQTSSQSIDTGIKIMGFGLTGNVLLVKGAGVVMAWLLTEEGLVNNVLGSKRASHSDSIWTMPLSQYSQPKFLVEGETGAISSGETLFMYNARTGEVLEPTQEPLHLHGIWYSFKDSLQAKDYGSDSSPQNLPSEVKQKPTETNLTMGWMKDDHGKCLLWVPTEWRVAKGQVQWFPDISTMKFKSKFGKPTIIKLQ